MLLELGKDGLASLAFMVATGQFKHWGEVGVRGGKQGGREVEGEEGALGLAPRKPWNMCYLRG
jgi:hypothetical protein